ncbi:phosphoenolpyruvate--protein phosphotransferase, partial [bacterium]|nr:phosphoenolpyruvate--protein phosphotransferase [bacterium]
GVEGLVDNLYCGAELVVDADHGKVVIGPNNATRENYKIALQEKKHEKSVIKDIIKAKSCTSDDHKIEIHANIGSTDQIPDVAKFKAHGVGLLRTEFVFLQKYIAPTEEEQIEIYKKIIEDVGPKKVVTFRVLDIGGDKKVAYMVSKDEENPYLGIRGIRFLLREKVFFKTQLRALLRLSHLSRFRILYPMISNYSELMEIKVILKDTIAELAMENYIVDEKNIQHGIMIEVPSAVLMLDILLPEVDFASIGTNDLLQYTIAVDRNNRELTGVYNKLSPALLQFLNIISKKCKKAGKPLSVCGEIAGNSRYTLPLIGLGITELSMTSTMIPYVKDVIMHNSMSKAKRLANKLLKMKSAEEVENYISQTVIKKVLS